MARHRIPELVSWAAILIGCLVVGTACAANPTAPVSPAGGSAGIEHGAMTPASEAPLVPERDPVASDWRHTDQVLEQGLPRSTTFANVEFELTGALVSWQTPVSYESGDSLEPSEVPHAFLELTAHNRASRIRAQLPDDIFRLVLPDGDEAGVVRGGFGSLEPDSASDGFLAFEVPESLDLSEAVLQVGRRPDTPAFLPLAGDIPTSGYPIQLGSTGIVEAAGQLWGSPVTFELLYGELSKDVVVDACCPDTGPRADEDEVFATFTLRVTGPDDHYGEQVGPRSARLLVDDVPREPWHAPLVTTKGAAVDVHIGFVIPAGARDLVLQLGDSSAGPPARIEIELPHRPLTSSQATSPGYRPGTVMAVLADYPRTAKLVELLESTQTMEGRPGAGRAVDVVELMSRPHWNHAIFAPSDAALDALPAADQELLATDPNARIEFFRRHVVQAAIPLAELRNLDSVMTLDGFVSVDTAVKTIRVGGARILAGDVAASNGVIHVIDAVIE